MTEIGTREAYLDLLIPSSRSAHRNHNNARYKSDAFEWNEIGLTIFFTESFYSSVLEWKYSGPSGRSRMDGLDLSLFCTGASTLWMD